MTTEFVTPARRVKATMHRAYSKDVGLVRTYAYFDTAMPRMMQMAMTYWQEGDFVEFESIEFGWHLGTLRIKKHGKFEVEMNPLVKANPSLLKLMSEDPQFASRFV